MNPLWPRRSLFSGLQYELLAGKADVARLQVSAAAGVVPPTING